MGRMMRASCLVLLVVLMSPLVAAAQLLTPSPVGGLTALPRTDPSMWPDLIVDGGFETAPVLSTSTQGGPWVPTAASEAAWSVDNTTAHSGTASMKMTGVAGAEAYEVFHLPAGVYTFTGYIKTGPRGTGRARLMLDFRTWRYTTVPSSCTADCGVNNWYTSQEIYAGANWTQVSVTFTVADSDIAAAKPNPSYPGTIEAFAVLDGYWADATLIAWYDDVKLLQRPNFPLDVFMRYPNYRGMVFGDQDGTLSFHVTPLPAYANAKYSVQSTLRAEGGAQLEAKITALDTVTVDPDTGKPGVDITLNTGNSLGAVGDYQPVLAEFTLVDGNGKEITPRYPAYRVYKVPASDRPKMNVNFNVQNQVVLGIPPSMTPAPHFLLGVYDSGLGSVDSTTNWENVLFSPSGARRMDGLPIDLYLNYMLGDTGADVINNLMTTLTSHGVGYLQTGNCYSSTPASSHNSPYGFKIDQAGTDGTYPYISQGPPTGIGQVVGGYYVADECTADMVDGVFAQRQHLVEWDPDSMTFGALLGGPDLPLWRDSIDVISTDPYPLYGAEPVGGYDHGQVARWTRMNAQAVQHSRPIMTVLQFFKFDASRSNQGRWPTQTEMRNHAYMAIVEGAEGLMWWSLGDNGLDAACKRTTQWCTQRTQLMTQLKAVVSEISSLDPMLLKPDSSLPWGSVSGVTENSTPAATLPTPTIVTKVKHDDATGQDYIFAYNSTPYYDPNVASPSVTAQFRLPSTPQSITVYGESRQIARSGEFSDTFGPFAAHVYVITY